MGVTSLLANPTPLYPEVTWSRIVSKTTWLDFVPKQPTFDIMLTLEMKLNGKICKVHCQRYIVLCRTTDKLGSHAFVYADVKECLYIHNPRAQHQTFIPCRLSLYTYTCRVCSLNVENLVRFGLQWKSKRVIMDRDSVDIDSDEPCSCRSVIEETNRDRVTDRQNLAVWWNKSETLF